MNAPVKHIRHYIFLKDVLLLALTAFGGAQAHLGLFYNVLVKKRKYISEEDLTDLYSFCQILPGPASTQTITAVGFRIGGPRLAFLTLLIWILPAVSVMTLAAIAINFIDKEMLGFTKYISAVAVGFVCYAGYKICLTALGTKTSYIIFVISGIACYFIKNPVIFPFILIMGGLATSWRYRKQPKEEVEPLKIEWSNFFLFGGIFLGAALLGQLTYKYEVLSISFRLFENFFRNGSLIFGGGQSLIGLFYTEFVEFKQYLSETEFLTGYAVLQGLPGPIFSFSSFIGSLSMRDYGLGGQIAGGLIGAAGIFLPGTILIFFVIRFWNKLKKYRIVKASLEGLNASSAGLVAATGIVLFRTLIPDSGIADGWMDYLIVVATFCTLLTEKIPSPFIILAALGAGFIF